MYGLLDDAAQLTPEAQVVADEDVQVAGPRGAFGLIRAAPDGDQHLGGGPAQRLLRAAAEDALDDQGAGLDHGAEVVGGEGVHLEAAVLFDVEQALGAQVEQRLAHRGRGDAVLLGDLLDGEGVAGGQPPGQHLVAQRVGDLLAQGAAPYD